MIEVQISRDVWDIVALVVQVGATLAAAFAAWASWRAAKAVRLQYEADREDREVAANRAYAETRRRRFEDIERALEELAAISAISPLPRDRIAATVLLLQHRIDALEPGDSDELPRLVELSGAGRSLRHSEVVEAASELREFRAREMAI